MSPDQKTKILMIDDERFLLDIYKTYFEKEEYEVTTSYSADTALDFLRAGLVPDVILFDISIPESKSGYEFLEIVQHEHLATRALKIALTNEGQPGEIARTTELGANAHLIKAEFTPSELVATVTQLLLKHR
ncbi:response regulator [Candidatus Parcubacteria bacterium]|nr:MAG: response regulator [Candidatus Parcubacteria bacterium]